MTKEVTIEVFERQDFSGLVVWAYAVKSTERTLKVGSGWASSGWALNDARTWAKQNELKVATVVVAEPSLSLIFG
jgi:hypothetical protein